MDTLHDAWELVERAVERVIEDVLWIFEGLGDAVASVLVLEFEGVGGVVGIADLGGDVGDDDWGGLVGGDDGDVLGQEEDGEVVSLFEGEHGGLYLVLVGGVVVIERGRAETGGGGTDDVELALGDAGEVDVFGTAELIHGEEREVWFAVGYIERFGEVSVVDSEGEECSAYFEGFFYSGREDVDGEIVEGGLGGDGVLCGAHEYGRGAAFGEDGTLDVAGDGAVREGEEGERLEGIKGNGVGREGVEEEGLDVVGCGVVWNVYTAIEGFTLGGVHVLVLALGEDDERCVDESVGEEIALDDGADVVEDYLTVVGIERGGEDGVSTALDGDVKGGCVGGDGY